MDRTPERRRADRVGVVAAFDEPKGWGTVRDETGDERWFHCTAIADGSRAIDVGTPVHYRLVAGTLGAWEAGDVRPR